MHRVPAIVVFLAAAAFLPAPEAQMRAPQRVALARASAGTHLGVARSGGFRVVNARPLGRRTLFVGPVAFHHQRFHISFGNSCFIDPFIDPFFCRQFFFRNPFLFTQPVFLPYPVYAGPAYPVAEQTPLLVMDREGDLATEVERLTGEVKGLREEESSREQVRQAPPPSRPSAEENIPKTILVFRDGHRSEVRNYAIVGQTLWVFTEQRAQKFALSLLDVEATKKVNGGRGVEFRLP